MNNFNKNLAKALFNPEKINNVFRKELQKAVNDLLESELTSFLGYDPYDRSGWNSGNSRNGVYVRKINTQFGQIEVQVPRDRNGQFHQHTLPVYSQHSDVLESMIIKMYSQGVTTREIAELLEKMYGVYYTPAQVSIISKDMIPKVQAYHQRKLSDKFFCVYLDATYVPLRRDTYQREAVYIALGIKPDGHKEVLDYCIEPTENVVTWTHLLQSLKDRGLKQVELFLSDGVVGMKDALCQTFPKAHFQRCLVHVMRNICAKVRVRDREQVMKEFKRIHYQTNKGQAMQVLHEFYEHWESKYKAMVKDLKAIEPDLLTFYNYPPQIRASIYSTNLIESFNNRLKRKLKPKVSFSTEQGLDTFIGVQVMDYNTKYFNRVHKGFGEVQDTLESYFD